jgi:hypothetical protein
VLRRAEKEIPKNGQQVRPKHVGALINKLKTAVQQFGVKFYVRMMAPVLHTTNALRGTILPTYLGYSWRWICHPFAFRGSLLE